MSFLLLLVGFMEKWTKRKKSGQLRGVLHSDKETPRSGEGPRNGEGSPHRSEVEREG